MVLSEIRTRVRYHLREATANIWTDAELTDHINLAQKYVALRLDSKYLPQLMKLDLIAFSTDATEDLATDFLKAVGNPFHVTKGTLYPLLPFAEAMEAQAHYLQSGSLFTDRLFSYMAHQSLWLSRWTEAVNITMPYIAAPAALSGDADVSEIEDGVIDLVIEKATYDSMLKTRNTEEMKLILSALEKRIDDLNKRV